MTDREVAAALVETAQRLATIAACLTERQEPGPDPDDRMLEAAEAAARLGLSVRQLYRRADALPFTVHVGKRTLRFSERGLRAHLRGDAHHG